MAARFPKAARLTRRREFLAVQERGRRLYADEAVLVLALPGEAGRARLGLTVSTKVGNAVVRNRVKRWLREAWRRGPAWPALDLVVVARAKAPELGYEGAARALERARVRAAGGGDAK